MRRAALLIGVMPLLAITGIPTGTRAAAETPASASTGPLGPHSARDVTAALDGASGWAVQRPAATSLSAAPLVAASGAVALQGSAAAADGPQYLVGRVTGTPGRQVEVTLDGTPSAPITLHSASQAFGVTAPHPDSGTVDVAVVALGAWAPGDSLDVTGVSLGTSGPNVTSLQAGTREVLLNGQPFTAKGYVYGDSPIGTPGPFGVDGWADFPADCQTDAALLGGAGATLIRLFTAFPDPAPTQRQTQCLDAFAANGVGVEFDLFPPIGMNPGTAGFMTEFPTQIAQQISGWKDNPATLFWELENEVEGSGDSTPAAWYGSAGNPGQLNTLAADVRADDSNHLVGTGVTSGGPGGCLGWIASSDAPELQFWGLHLYGDDAHLATRSCTLNGTTASTEATAASATTIPVMVEEFGVDRYFCTPGFGGWWVQWLLPVNVSGTAYACATPGSFEDQADQASYLSTAWSDMSPYLSGSSNQQAPFFGGLDWEYADKWWGTEASVFDPLPATPWTHETDAVQGSVGQLPNDGGWLVPEFFSVNDALTPGDTGERVSTLGFDALEQGWLGTSLPTISAAGAALSAACPAVTVTWTTSAAMTSQVDVGPRIVQSADGQMTSDSTYYMQAVDDATAVTSHRVTLSGLIPGQDYQITVRSFTSSGESVTTTPLDVTWTPAVPPSVSTACPAPNMPPLPAAVTALLGSA
ncbi:MAG TPA: fibronectin type III domain-containing protein [Candidatus Dormibacteraeota bacterium]|nr:fibronectin type III domain-containing protein [Candidatus Dormibacteraeota bacterium]